MSCFCVYPFHFFPTHTFSLYLSLSLSLVVFHFVHCCWWCHAPPCYYTRRRRRRRSVVLRRRRRSGGTATCRRRDQWRKEKTRWKVPTMDLCMPWKLWKRFFPSGTLLHMIFFFFFIVSLIKRTTLSYDVRFRSFTFICMILVSFSFC